MDREEVLAAAKEQVSAARDIEALFGSKGWQIYRVFLKVKIDEIRSKDNYSSLHQLNADRKLVKILVGLEDELKDVLSSGETAGTIINKLTPQTSDESIPLDSFETETK